MIKTPGGLGLPLNTLYLSTAYRVYSPRTIKSNRTSCASVGKGFWIMAELLSDVPTMIAFLLLARYFGLNHITCNIESPLPRQLQLFFEEFQGSFQIVGSTDCRSGSSYRLL